MFGKRGIKIMVIVISALLLFIAVLLFWKNLSMSVLPLVNIQIGQTSKNSLKAGKEATKGFIEETKKDKTAQIIVVNKKDGSSEEVLIVAPQSNPISVATGEVLTRDGSKAANNMARPGDVDAPLQSAPVDVNKLPDGTIKLVVTPISINPAEFTVKAGQAVVLAVTAAGSVEIFKFDDASLTAVVVGLEPRQTRVITFNAPNKPGEYVFYSDFAGHRSAGAVGKMKIK
jgi:uncharacterized cupredoxin-like copper-binding protein